MENTNSPMLSPAEVFKANVQLEINKTKMHISEATGMCIPIRKPENKVHAPTSKPGKQVLSAPMQ